MTMWETIRVNFKNKTAERSPVKKEYHGIGGKSMVAQFLTDEVNPKCDPLGDENKLIFCSGIFAGTKLTTAHRMSIGAKSPLTRGIKESNVGGDFVFQMSKHGIKSIILEDLPEDDQWSVLYIGSNGEGVLHSADGFVGLNTYELFDKLRDKYGKDVSITGIGSAGERLYRIASVMVSEFKTGYPCRAAGRGGLGAVMGSKKLKAVVMAKPAEPYELEYANKEAFDSACLAYNKALAQNVGLKGLMEIGTIVNIDSTSKNAIMPTRNFSGEFSKVANTVTSDVFMDNVAKRGGSAKQPCQPGCVIHCSNHYYGKDGKYLTGALEYETVVLCGPNLDIGDYDTIAQIDRMCDEMGVDTMDTGAAIGVCMDHGLLEFGDAKGTLDLVQQMMDGTDFGRILGDGCEATGLHIGAKRIPTVKRQAIAAYDPRMAKGTGVTYATSPMGADHTAGLTAAVPMDGTSKAAQLVLAQKLGNVMTLADSCLCIFAGLGGAANMPLLFQMYGALTGIEPTPENFFMKLTIGTLKLEKDFNRAAGFTDDDDRLPEFFSTERSPATGAVFDIEHEDLLTVRPF